MSLDRPLAQREAKRRKTAVITTRIKLDEHEKIVAHAKAKGYGEMGTYLRDLVRKDAGLDV